MSGMGKHALDKIRAKWEGAGRWQTAAVVTVIVLVAAGLAIYCAAASYDTVSHLAVRYRVALPRLNPLGIDGGLAGLIIFDIALTSIREPIWWLRLAVRVFAAGMVGANMAAGWPSPVGVGLRIGAPVLFVIITEAARTWLLRRMHAEERAKKVAERLARRAARLRRRKDRIPLIRWVLDPRGTFALWRRMRLWREPSYRVAVSMELERLAAIEKLAMHYGTNSWRVMAPADLVWMLESGVRMPEALTRVPELIGTENAVAALRSELDSVTAAREADEGTLREELEGERAARETAQRETAEALMQVELIAQELADERQRRARRQPRKTPRGSGAGNAHGNDLTTEFRAAKLLEADPELRGDRMGGELGRRLGVSPATGRRLHSRLVVDGKLVKPPAERSAENADARTGERS